MPKKKERVIEKNDHGHLTNQRVDFGRLKKIKKDKWRRRKRPSGKDSLYIEKSEVLEDAQGKKYVRNSMTSSGAGRGSHDWHTAKNFRRGNFMAAGKGDAPRNMGPKFKKNYDEIDWGEKKEKTKNGVPKPKKFIKKYK